MQQFLLALGQKYGLSFQPLNLEELELYSYQEQIDLLLEEQIRIVSFTFGILDAESIARLKRQQVI